MSTGEISIVVSIVIQTIAVVFFYGRLTEKVNSHTDILDDHRERIRDLEKVKL